VFEHGSLLIVFRSIGSLLQLCLSIWSLLLVLAVSICNQILHFSELSLEVQGGHDYFRFVEGTCIIALCLSSLSLFYPLHFSIWTSLQKLYSNCFWPVTSVGEKEEKTNTIQPLLLVFFSPSHFLLVLRICVLPKGMLSSFIIISLNHIGHWDLNVRNMFWTWMKVGIRFCPIILNIPTCFGHLQSGSDLVTK